jgi:hypothetical protein
MDGNICDPLSGHFIRNEHGRVTRNSGCLAILPELNMHAYLIQVRSPNNHCFELLILSLDDARLKVSSKCELRFSVELISTPRYLYTDTCLRVDYL